MTEGRIVCVLDFHCAKQPRSKTATCCHSCKYKKDCPNVCLNSPKQCGCGIQFVRTEYFLE